ncbi:MAG TPA: F0F1 ATP synthase subunit gamma [Acidimicrobiia bacterium]|jgi:F-type H+-transporting ATPase subunit gamma|nr:F0F1 ATP synthase subunit gamma [Acidimicrobiia bacterium]
MAGQERILRRRIRSVQSTKKITRAMELIASSRIVRAQAAVRAAQPYSDGITNVVEHLAEAGAGGSSPLMTPRAEVKTVAQIVIAADRGLCGGYNTSVLRAAELDIAAQQRDGHGYALVAVGRKVESYLRYREYRIDAAFTGFSDQPSYENARAVAAAVTGKFLAGEIDIVQLVYTKFISAGTQTVVLERLMPLETHPTGVPAATNEAGEPQEAYEFEPGPDAILDALLPRYAESRIFAALLNAAASEHAARQRAMKAATDNADDLITSLSRVMNRARQEQITTEIMEIVGGAEALGSGRADDVREHPRHLRIEEQA